MQQHCEIKRAAIIDQSKQFLGTRDRLKLTPFKRRDAFDRQDRVLIYGVVMVHIKLSLRDNAAKLRQEPAKHARFVHPPKNPPGGLRFKNVGEKQIAHLILFAQLWRYSAHGPRRSRHGVWMNVSLFTVGNLKQTEQVRRVLFKNIVVFDRDAPAIKLETRFRQRFSAARDHTSPAFDRRFLFSLQFCSEDARQTADIFRGKEIALHEPFNTELVPAVTVAQALGNFRLQIKAQPLLCAAG